MEKVLAPTNIPVFFIKADCLPQAWEEAVLAVWDKGLEIKTQYDKPEDPPSKDATVMISVARPFDEPRIHKNLPGGPVELESYCQEVLKGIHDDWVDPAGGKWTYTYHQRLFDYCGVKDTSDTAGRKNFRAVDQIQYIIDTLSDTGHTRRAQAITWIPETDAGASHPPCLQRIWCRLTSDETGRLALNMNTHWRSRDLYKAWFMNAYAFTLLQKMIAEGISDKIGRPVQIGRYLDISDSLHIYGSYSAEVRAEVKKMRRGDFRNRSWQSTHPAFVMMTEEARENLKKNPDFYAKPQQ